MTGSFSPKLLGSAIALVGGGASLAALAIGSGPEAWGPRTVPMLAGAVMGLAGVAMMKEPAGEPREPAAARTEMRAFSLVFLSAAYVLCIGGLGYVVATAIAAPVFLWLFGTRSPVRLLTAALLCPAALHVFFFELLGIFPPRAAWDLADHLPF